MDSVSSFLQWKSHMCQPRALRRVFGSCLSRTVEREKGVKREGRCIQFRQGHLFPSLPEFWAELETFDYFPLTLEFKKMQVKKAAVLNGQSIAQEYLMLSCFNPKVTTPNSPPSPYLQV